MAEQPPLPPRPTPLPKPPAQSVRPGAAPSLPPASSRPGPALPQPKTAPVGAAGLPLEDVPVEESIHRGWMQQPWVQDILPFVSSLALHIMIVVMGWLLYEGVKQATAPA